MKAHIIFPNLSQLLQDFFCQNLINQRNVSQQTIAAYRDAFRLLLKYASERIKKPPVKMCIDDLDRSLVLDFLTCLETQRNNSIRTRNARLAAIRSFMHYAAYKEPVSLPVIQGVLSIPMKRFQQPVMEFLSLDEIDAILDAPDPSTWSGRRDRVMFTVFYNTGARASEVIKMQVKDIHLERSASVLIHGKGRKDRAIPLWKTTTAMLKLWLMQLDHDPEIPVFPNRSGKHLSLTGVEDRLRVAVRRACKFCPALQNRKISPHTIRHTTAMHLLQSGVDLAVIALWLGHESPATTHLYMEADLAMKEKALEKLQETPNRSIRYKPGDRLLRFLDRL
ncbi:MAG: site-specific integrase [Deltaproteobacteria bacterium]|nr:site-specific integrase [Deltaproteobacteria bacterium]